jgi:cytosine/adenosine deaminase-related metal-dependent hydrolase
LPGESEAAVQRLIVRADWTIVHREGWQVPTEGVAIVIEQGRIADVTHNPPSEGERIDMPGGIAFPGFVNLHNHTINAPLFRGIVDDLPRKAIGESKVYSMLMPMGTLAISHLAPEELEALVALGLLEVAKSGATTMVDQFRPRQTAILELAKRWGLRLYAAPYLFSPAGKIGDASVAQAAQGSFEGETGLAAFEELFARFDEGERGRIRVILGPHAADSCAPDLLAVVDRLARERGLLATIHLAQSQGEVDRVRAKRGLDPAGYMASVGLLRKGVIFAHGVHLSDDELARVRDSGAAIAHCASVFLRGGKAPTHARFAAHGVRIGIGTDAERMDMFAQLRASGFASKQATGAGDAATAADLFRAATIGGADALQRPDLGRIERGAAADIVLVDAHKPHLQPVNDPIRTLVWYASSADIDTVIVAGRPIVRGGRLAGADERDIVRRGAEATRKIWDESRRRGHFPAEAEPARA